jgi:hypothetical protein
MASEDPTAALFSTLQRLHRFGREADGRGVKTA